MAETRDKLIIMLSVMTATFLSALDQTIVATALPSIIASLGGIEFLSWIVSSYLLTSTITIVIYGKLSDMYGRKRLLILGIGIFLAGSVLAGLSQDIVQLVVFRAIQGIGGGAIMGTALAIIGDLFAPAERGKWQGLSGAVFALSSVIGPFLGGFITDVAGWHWIFFINVPIGLFSIAILTKFLPHIKVHSVKSVDYKGSVTLTLALVSMMLGLLIGGSYYPWVSVQTLGLFAFSAGMFVLFIQAEMNAKEPILPLSMFSNKIFLISSSVGFITSMGLFGAIVFIPLFVQFVLGRTATNSGLILTPLVLAMVGSSMVSGQVMSRTGKYKLMTVSGVGAVVAGMLMLSFMGVGTSDWELVRNMAIVGIGLGITFPTFIIAVQNAFDHSKIGVVTASLQFFRNIGGMFGVAIFGALLVASFNGNSSVAFVQNPEALLAGISSMTSEQVLAVKAVLSSSLGNIFLVSTAITSAAFVLTLFLKEIPLRKTHKPVLEEAGIELAEEEGFFNPKDEPVEK
ncbi:MFS transporter [archaeon]|nr:MAG: MFS transporter [archaeon]